MRSKSMARAAAAFRPIVIALVGGSAGGVAVLFWIICCVGRPGGRVGAGLICGTASIFHVINTRETRQLIDWSHRPRTGPQEGESPLL